MRLLLLLSTIVPAVTAQPTREISVDVDPRVELFSIVQVIAGRMNNGLSTRYARDVEQYFSKYRDHRAIRMIQSMVSGTLAWGIPAAIGVAVTNPPELRPTRALPTDIALTPIAQDTVDAYVAAVRDFARASDFERFFRAHQRDYDQFAAVTRARLKEFDYLREVENFWGTSLPSYSIHLSPLMPAGGVGPRVTRPDGLLEVHSILGASGSQDSLPQFGSAGYLRNLVLHEFSHSFVNPITERHHADVARWEVLMEPVRNRLRQADGLRAWPETVNELIIRAFTTNVTAKQRGDSVAERVEYGQRQLGFAYLPRFRAWLRDYSANRAQWPTFAAYYPELIRRFGELTAMTRDSTEMEFRGDFSMARWYNEEFFPVFIVPTGERDAALQDSLYALVRKVRDQLSPRSMIVRDVDALNQDLSAYTLWAWGTVDGNAWLKKNRAALPIAIEPNRIIADSVYSGENHIVMMALRNPQNLKHPLLVSTGQRIEEVATQYWVWDADYVVMRAGKIRAADSWPRKSQDYWGFPR